MKIVEQERTNILASIQSWLSLGRDESSDDKIEIGLHELIDTIHSAAADKDIVALYGTLGHGFRFQCGGYAHLEEVRDAIRVFNESHRIHEHRALSTGSPKLIKHSYVYTDSFDNPSDPANREYFLASAFSCILMQPRGNLSLFGMTMTTPFLRGFLDKYGIKVREKEFLSFHS
jgi:protease-4